MFDSDISLGETFVQVPNKQFNQESFTSGEMELV
jgi:hypothetical protein